MGNHTNPAKWEARQRLEFIELATYWRGWIRRSDLQNFFGISLPQASADFQAYLTINPGSLDYDLRGKRYLAAKKMKALLIRPDLSGAIGIFLGTERKSHARTGDRVATIDLPYRRVPPEVAQCVFRAVYESLAAEIHYFSIKSASADWRWISPHAFGFDGHRWHARAWCHEDRTFKDFVLGRISRIRGLKPLSEKPPMDKDWNTWVTVKLKAHETLNTNQRRALEADYSMRNGFTSIRVRKAMLIYTLAHLRIEKDGDIIPERLQLVEG